MIHPDATIDECMQEISALEAENEQLRAGLREALGMVESFASGAGFSYSGRAAFDRLAALAGLTRT
jgi:hypothetical protein